MSKTTEAQDGNTCVTIRKIKQLKLKFGFAITTINTVIFISLR